MNRVFNFSFFAVTLLLFSSSCTKFREGEMPSDEATTQANKNIPTNARIASTANIYCYRGYLSDVRNGIDQATAMLSMVNCMASGNTWTLGWPPEKPGTRPVGPYYVDINSIAQVTDYTLLLDLLGIDNNTTPAQLDNIALYLKPFNDILASGAFQAGSGASWHQQTQAVISYVNSLAPMTPALRSFFNEYMIIMLGMPSIPRAWADKFMYEYTEFVDLDGNVTLVKTPPLVLGVLGISRP